MTEPRTMDLIIREQARLIILKALEQQPDETLNSDILVHELAPFGIRRDRAWVHNELDRLVELGAVSVMAVGTVRVATLTELGARHLSRHVALEGIQRPSRPGS